MSSKIGIIGQVDRAWTDLWQVEANIMARLATRYPTVWMEPPVHWRQAAGRTGSASGFRRPEGAPELEVYTPPPWLPAVHRPATLRRLLSATRLRTVRRHLLAKGVEQVLLYVWRPNLAEALDLVEHDAALYHICDEYTFSRTDQPIPPDERTLLAEADQVIVHSPALLEKKGDVNPHTVMIPNGVDYAWFAEPSAEPSELAGIPRPRIGYCGYVKRQLDWELLTGLVERHTEWSWVFVGQASPHPELDPILESLSARPHVHFLGAKGTRELARYPQHFDACIMPYRIDDYTKYIFPLKLHEYLASGSPTVGTPIRTLRDFGDVVELAEGVDAWSEALRRALEPEAREPSAVERRQAVARKYDWSVLVDRVADAIERTLARGQEAQPSSTGSPDDSSAASRPRSIV